MSAAAVTTVRRDGVLIIHLDDGKANALSFAMIAAIETALDEAEVDESAVPSCCTADREGSRQDSTSP